MTNKHQMRTCRGLAYNKYNDMYYATNFREKIFEISAYPNKTTKRQIDVRLQNGEPLVGLTAIALLP